MVDDGLGPAAVSEAEIRTLWRLYHPDLGWPVRPSVPPGARRPAPMAGSARSPSEVGSPIQSFWLADPELLLGDRIEGCCE